MGVVRRREKESARDTNTPKGHREKRRSWAAIQGDEVAGRGCAVLVAAVALCISDQGKGLPPPARPRRRLPRRLLEHGEGCRSPVASLAQRLDESKGWESADKREPMSCLRTSLCSGCWLQPMTDWASLVTDCLARPIDTHPTSTID